MQYAVLVYEVPGSYDGLSETEMKAVGAEYMAIRDDARVTGGAALQPVTTATTIRVQDGETLVTDGPFADTKEVFGGFYLVDAGNLDAAIEIASRIPSARMGGSVEIRPLVPTEQMASGHAR